MGLYSKLFFKCKRQAWERLSFYFNLNLMIKKSKNVQKAFVSSGLSYDLNSSVLFVQFWPSCKAQHPCSVPDSSLLSGSLEVSLFPIKSVNY